MDKNVATGFVQNLYNLKYESVHIDSKQLFSFRIRKSWSIVKKETTDELGLYVKFWGISPLFQQW